MKKILIALFIVLSASTAFAAHIIGGEMIYEYLSTNADGSKKYRITLRLYKDVACEAPPPLGTNCAQMPNSVLIGIFNNDTKAQFPGTNQPFTVNRSSIGPIPIAGAPPCIIGAPTLNYSFADYPFVVDLPDNTSGYTATYQTCCRTTLNNIVSPSGPSGTGSTYNCIIPGTSTLGNDKNNSSPKFNLSLSIICQERPFTLDFSAIDSDGLSGDSLVYAFSDAYNGGLAISSADINPQPPLAAVPPQYNPVTYINGFTAITPLGNNATINPSTGIISGIAPAVGKYVVCVDIKEYRAGQLIGYHRKDFIVNVSDCDFTSAELPPSYSECHDSIFTFSNNFQLDPTAHTYEWNFGDGNTSTLPTPTHQYSDTGTYLVTFIVKRGTVCTDTATTKVLVYPGFFLGFTSAGICATKPTQFNDTTKTRYGSVNSWRWNFGDLATLADTSRIKNPVYSYPINGTKNVSLIVGTDKGCLDTVSKSIEIMDKPPLSLPFRDTLICNGDTLQLRAVGTGNFSWTPNTAMLNPNTATPLVFPTVTTVYTARLNDQGCINSDSIQVRVVDFVTINAVGDKGICLTDSVQLGAATNGLRFEWTPAADFSNPNLLAPFARPTSAFTEYVIRAHIGHCSRTDTVIVRTSPYPKAAIGADTVICFNTPALLQGSIDGTSFSWSPTATLINANTLTPTARPKDTITYVLTVFDASGFCPKPHRDSIVVAVVPKINAYAGRDTSVVTGQPLQFTASGGVAYNWVPATGLNNAAIFNPIGTYNGSFETIRYKVLVSSIEGCTDSAFVNVKVYKTIPSIFVPTAFTPDGDGRNDAARPIAVGIKKIEYFRIYNRWGQLVFQTTTNGKGWDGKLGYKDQGTNVFVWMVKAVDYLDKPYFGKGTITLIR
ncbi:MAG: type sorting protein [Flaviaesturariibacter sp.]|nr:type sorting protein [Flaviaesturariibacter sp.]